MDGRSEDGGGAGFDEAVYAARGTEPVVAALSRFAAGGSVLELGAGSSRVALALAGAGVDVTGIDPSGRALDALRARAGAAGAPISLAVGNMRDFEGGPYNLVYALGNRICHLLSQDDQVACFANASQALEEDGLFLIETTLLPEREAGRVTVESGGRETVLRAESYDRLTQIRSMATLAGRDGAVRVRPSRVRYTSPAEFDLMARLAGLDLKARWGNWTGDPVTLSSPYAVSLYALQEANWLPFRSEFTPRRPAPS